MINIATENPMSVDDAATLCKVDPRTIHAWFDRGLERVKLGGRVYTSREALQRFSERCSPIDHVPSDEEAGAEAARKLKAEFGIG